MMIVGLCGGSGAGKSTIIEMVKEKFPGQVSVIDMDNYYISRDELPFEERRLVNYDIPESLDWEMIISHMERLKRGGSIEQPQFTFQTYERTEETVTTVPSPILIVDGIFSFYHEELCSLYDLKVFVDVPSDVRLARRMQRNIERYGRTAEFEIEQYYKKVKPMHDKYVEPCKKKADFVFSFEEKSERSIASFLTELETVFSTKSEKMTENRKN